MQENTIVTPAGIQTTVQLSDEDARAMGLTAAETVAQPAKARTAPNKARSPRNKQV